MGREGLATSTNGYPITMRMDGGKDLGGISMKVEFWGAFILLDSSEKD